MRFRKAEFPRTLLMLAQSVIRNTGNTAIISGGGILAVLDGTRRISPPDIIIVLLFPPSYHFPEFSHRKQRLSRRFLPEIQGIRGENHCPGFYMILQMCFYYHLFQYMLLHQMIQQKTASQSLIIFQKRYEINCISI